MTQKEKAVKYATRSILSLLMVIYIIGFICIISSMFVLIWIGWFLSLKIFLTGIVIVIISGYAYLSIKKQAEKIYDELIGKKSFKERLEEKRKENL